MIRQRRFAKIIACILAGWLALFALAPTSSASWYHRHHRHIKRVAIGAAIGAGVGAVAGGGKGALIGTAVGAGAGEAYHRYKRHQYRHRIHRVYR